MNSQEYKQFLAAQSEPRLIGIGDLANRAPRTLIYGYTINRDTFHVYIGRDSKIHVLQYSDLHSRATESGPKFLTLHHSSGVFGGVTDNAKFVPNKRVYPESCDLEFCTLLRNFGVHIPFTTFSEGSHEQRTAQHSGYAGRTLEDGGVAVVDVHDAVVKAAGVTGELSARGITARVILEVSKNLCIPTHVNANDMLTEYVLVAETGVGLVIDKAGFLLKGLEETTVFDHDLSENLLRAVFDDPYAPSIYSKDASGGEIRLDMDSNGANFQGGANSILVESKDSASHWKKGVAGTYKGRPFIAVASTTGQVHLSYSQFGDCSQFGERVLRMYGLLPAQQA